MNLKNVDKTTWALGIVTILVSIFAILASSDNVWNTPKFDIQVSKNDETKSPVTDILKTVFNDTSSQLTADWLRDRDFATLGFLKTRLSSNDAWVIDRIYSTTTNGTSQKIIIKNSGNAQAHDIIIQILGTDNFKIIDYTCPEILSANQLTKEYGKKYLISMSRMSIQLECVITINSVGDNGVEKVVVTANEANPAVWPDDAINNLRNAGIYLNSALYASIILLIFMIWYYVTIHVRKKPKIS